jgi:hypothetical protein
MSQSLFPPKMSAVINMMAFYPSERNADISADPYRGDYSPPTIGVIRPVYFRLRFSIDHQNTFATSGSDPSPSFFRFARAAREMTELCAKKCFPIRKRKKNTHTECIEKRDHQYVCPDKFRAVSPSDGTSHPPHLPPFTSPSPSSPRASQCPRPRTDRRACRGTRRSERRRRPRTARGRTYRRGSLPVRAWAGCRRLRNARRGGNKDGKHV